MTDTHPTAKQIDALLPQTQCGLCDYGGCKPYAEAMSTGEAEINRCPPGGIKVLNQLSTLMHVDATSHIADMQAQEKPPMLAKIREDECIGCVKCIKACPVDAIIGAAKQMHVVITDECTGCELCVAPCPMDCIDILTLSEESYDRDKARKRYNARNQRLDDKNKLTPKKKEIVSNDYQSYINAAIKRVKEKRQHKD